MNAFDWLTILKFCVWLDVGFIHYKAQMSHLVYMRSSFPANRGSLISLVQCTVNFAFHLRYQRERNIYLVATRWSESKKTSSFAIKRCLVYFPNLGIPLHSTVLTNNSDYQLLLLKVFIPWVPWNKSHFAPVSHRFINTKTPVKKHRRRARRVNDKRVLVSCKSTRG